MINVNSSGEGIFMVMFSGSSHQFYLTLTSRSVRYLCAFIGYLIAGKTVKASSDKSSDSIDAL